VNQLILYFLLTFSQADAPPVVIFDNDLPPAVIFPAPAVVPPKPTPKEPEKKAEEKKEEFLDIAKPEKTFKRLFEFLRKKRNE